MNDNKCSIQTCKKEAESFRFIKDDKGSSIVIGLCNEHFDSLQDAEFQREYEKHKEEIKRNPLLRFKRFITRNLHRFKWYRNYWRKKYSNPR